LAVLAACVGALAGLCAAFFELDFEAAGLRAAFALGADFLADAFFLIDLAISGTGAVQSPAPSGGIIKDISSMAQAEICPKSRPVLALFLSPFYELALE
jgi:hypothetical protein